MEVTVHKPQAPIALTFDDGPGAGTPALLEALGKPAMWMAERADMARKALRRDEILRRVWDYDFGGKTSIVDLYVSYLRKKIDTDREPMIHTVRGVGYVLRETP